MLVLSFCWTQSACAADPQRVETVSASSQADSPEDETRRLCALRGQMLGESEQNAILEVEKRHLKRPAEGSVLGDWKRGAVIAVGVPLRGAQAASGGGGCYVCHKMARSHPSYGTQGPSLTFYGRLRDFDAEEARTTYLKVYNPRATHPCSIMPRFGSDKILTKQQIKDVIAYLFDPDSPVNQD